MILLCLSSYIHELSKLFSSNLNVCQPDNQPTCMWTILQTSLDLISPFCSAPCLFPLQKNSLFCNRFPLICINLPWLAFSPHPSHQHNSLTFTNVSMLSNPKAHSLSSTPLLSYQRWTQWIVSTENMVNYTTWLWDNISSSSLLECGQLLRLLILCCLPLVSPPEADWSWS